MFFTKLHFTKVLQKHLTQKTNYNISPKTTLFSVVFHIKVLCMVLSQKKIYHLIHKNMYIQLHLLELCKDDKKDNDNNDNNDNNDGHDGHDSDGQERYIHHII